MLLLTIFIVSKVPWGIFIDARRGLRRNEQPRFLPPSKLFILVSMPSLEFINYHVSRRVQLGDRWDATVGSVVRGDCVQDVWPRCTECGKSRGVFCISIANSVAVKEAICWLGRLVYSWINWYVPFFEKNQGCLYRYLTLLLPIEF